MSGGADRKGVVSELGGGLWSEATVDASPWRVCRRFEVGHGGLLGEIRIVWAIWLCSHGRHNLEVQGPGESHGQCSFFPTDTDNGDICGCRFLVGGIVGGCTLTSCVNEASPSGENSSSRSLERATTASVNVVSLLGGVVMGDPHHHIAH